MNTPENQAAYEINPDAFGFYLSGLVDGEAHFQLSTGKNGKSILRRAEFSIAMRADDTAILERIATFWGCGTIFHYDPAKYNLADKRYDKKPMTRYLINRTSALHSILLPHFHRYPLLAKKARDFTFWEQGVVLLNSINHRRGYKKWFNCEKKQFDDLAQAMRDQRAYGSDRIEMPQQAAIHKATLFDDLPYPAATSNGMNLDT